MYKFEFIFDTLENLRTYTENQNLPISLRTVERAEQVALNEVCGISLKDGGVDYASVMAEIFPDMGNKPT